MRFSYTILVVLALAASSKSRAQEDSTFPLSIPVELKADAVSVLSNPSGYFSLKLKSVPQAPEQWLKDNGQAIGLTPEMSLRAVGKTKGVDNRTYQRFTQHLAGVPVLGGDVITQTDGQGNLLQLSGYLVAKDLFSASPQPTQGGPATSATNLADAALALSAKQSLVNDYPQALQWNTIDHGDIWVAANPWRPTPESPLRRCRSLEIQEPAGSQAEMVYVDLRTGKVVFRHPLHCSLQRQLHHLNVASANIVWREGDFFPGGLNDEDQEMIRSTEEVFSLYYRSFGREGHDGVGGQMRSVNKAALNGCPNARAFNYTILACEGVVGDDIVGHEWTHNYTGAMNGLLLSFESGAIQEGMADIFGEAVDLLNNRGLDDNDQLHRTGCFTDNYRWSIAEDATAIDTILRDIWAPTCKTDPDRRYSNLFTCNTPSGTDIHSNSTVLSRTFALLVDGDTTLTPSVRGIGLTKALHIFYHANANYVTRVTDFSALAAMLRQSAQDLQGTFLPTLTLINTVAPLSNDSITEADLASLDSAIAVTQLALPSQCPGTPVLGQAPPESCTDDDNTFINVFQETWEGTTAGWTLSETPVHPEDWSPKPWQISTTALPDGRPGQAMFAPNTNVGNCQSDRENGTSELTSPLITLPAADADFELHFMHYFSIEPDTDGGLVSYRLAGEEEFIPVPLEAFAFNPYNQRLDPAVLNDNPLAGNDAFTGADDLSTTGTWGKSIVDLSSIGLTEGSQFQLRWTLGHDGCGGWLGWYVDDIEVGYCGSRALPVTYLSITATASKNYIDLNWQTANELDNSGFYVERADDNAFRAIGFVPVNEAKVYSFQDTDLIPGTTYVYRLRQIDRDGSEHLSRLVSATTFSETALQVYPNPAPGTFTINGSGKQAFIYNLAGQLVLSPILSAGQGYVANLQPGVYLVRVGKDVKRIVVR